MPQPMGPNLCPLKGGMGEGRGTIAWITSLCSDAGACLDSLSVEAAS